MLQINTIHPFKYVSAVKWQFCYENYGGSKLKKVITLKKIITIVFSELVYS